MAVLKFRDENGNIVEVLAIKGEKGEKGADGTVTFNDLTDAQKESLKGDKGKDGYTPVKWIDYYTEADREEVVKDVERRAIGDIETAVDGIIAIQENLIGGDV